MLIINRVEELLKKHAPKTNGKGTFSLPANLAAVETLLADPIQDHDFICLDALFACWARDTENSDNRALLAVALALTEGFGLPEKRPMAAARAWRMLDPILYEEELAQQLDRIAGFIFSWQREQTQFLILEYGEIELIEHLFECLPPSRHTALLAQVMNFKVLSNRRMGLLRRIPLHLRRQITPLLPARKGEALELLTEYRALLLRIADPDGFAPIVDTATRVLGDIEKLIKAVSQIGMSPPPQPAGQTPTSPAVPSGRAGG